MAPTEPEAGYKRLEIYQLSRALAIRMHALSLRLPSLEKYEAQVGVREACPRESSRSTISEIPGRFLRYLYRSLIIR
jgi:hypothetical protein